MKLYHVCLLIVCMCLAVSVLQGCAVNVVVAPHAVVDVGYACKAGSDESR